MFVTVSKVNKALLVPDVSGVSSLFPSAPVLTGDGVNSYVLPHDMHHTLLLRHLGFKVPNPMLIYYDWAGGKPFTSQRTTCELLSENPRAYVLNDMGTGKTKASLWAWDYLYGQGLCKKMLVVAKLSNLNFTWAREAFATLPHRKCVVLHGSKDKRLKMLNTDADLFIINHDGVKVIAKELAARDDIDVLTLDELAVYRNNSDRSKQMRTFAQRFNIIWGLTGRPMPNAPTDVWSQCKIITPHTVPKYFKHAQEMLMKRLDQFRWLPKEDAVDKAFAMMQPSVRITLDEVVELPPVVYRTIDVENSDQQTTVYKKLIDDLRIMVEAKQITALNAGAAMNKLLQIACGWVYTTAPEFVRLDASPRIDALLDLIESVERKVMLLVPYRHALEGVSEILTKEGIDHATVHGDTNNRDNIFNLFQNTTKYKVLAAHPECVSHGLTLTAADTIIWYTATPSLDIYEQVNGRIRRYGQEHKQQVLHLQSTPVERTLYTLLRRKQKLQDTLLALFEDATAARTIS